MKLISIRIFLGLIAMTALVSLSAQEEAKWREFKSMEGRFRVVCPGNMQEKIDSVDTHIGRVAFHTYFFQSKDEKSADNLIYLVSYCDYPPNTIHSDSTLMVREFFEATMESAEAAVDGDMIYSREIIYRGFPGRLWRIHYLDGHVVIKTRAFLVGSRFYTIRVVTWRERSLNTAADRFLESFRTLEGAGPEVK